MDQEQQDCWEALRSIAEDLRQKPGCYWKTFRRIEALMAWLYWKGKCVYCNAELPVSEYMTEGLATTDHLLPRSRYPQLDFTNRNLLCRDPLNAVPACDGRNGIKSSWDPNLQGGEQIFFPERQAKLTPAIQEELIRRATDYIKGQRELRKSKIEDDLANWRESLAKREELPLDFDLS